MISKLFAWPLNDFNECLFTEKFIHHDWIAINNLNFYHFVWFLQPRNQRFQNNETNNLWSYLPLFNEFYLVSLRCNAKAPHSPGGQTSCYRMALDCTEFLPSFVEHALSQALTRVGGPSQWLSTDKMKKKSWRCCAITITMMGQRTGCRWTKTLHGVELS